MDNLKTGAFIKALRTELGLTQRELAERLHITDRAVSKWERGLNAPDIALLEPLAEALGVSVAELLRGGRTPEAEQAAAADVLAVLDYSRGEVTRKVSAVQKKYLGLLAGVLMLVLPLALLLAGAFLWRSGVLFQLDKKVSPDGENVIRVYSKEWDFWPLRFTMQDKLQTVGKIGDADLYAAYGSEEYPTAYEGLWWAPDSSKYVLAFRWLNEDSPYLELVDLKGNHGANLIAVMNFYYWLTQQGLAPRRDEPPKIEYQFLQWGKDSASMLIYYSYEDSETHEGYFWFNCETAEVSGILELNPA